MPGFQPFARRADDFDDDATAGRRRGRDAMTMTPSLDARRIGGATAAGLNVGYDAFDQN